MKTTKSITRSVKTSLVGFTSVMLVCILFASCTKEELAQPATNQETSNNARLINNNAQLLSRFIFIKIDHVSSFTSLPDYSVTLTADGTVTFDGRANVYTPRKRTFQATKSAMLQIHDLVKEYLSINVSSATAIATQNERTAKCRAYVATTISTSYDQLPKTNFDWNTGKPAKLVGFRTGVEEALEIYKLVDRSNISNGYPTVTDEK